LLHSEQSTSVPHANALIERFRTGQATIGVVGLGYVGLPLSRSLHEAGYSVVGFDTDVTKSEQLNRGESYLDHLGNDIAATLAASDHFTATADESALATVDAIVLCVPTPLGPNREPDLQYVLDSARMVARVLHPGMLVVLESTTYPGTTRQEVLPILEETKLRCGTDFFLAYSPEREDPGREGFETSTIPRLVGGIDDTSTDIAIAMYSTAIDQVHRVSSCEVAEAAKLLENIYRAVNIALVNEMKTLLTSMDVDVWEVIEAAATKPFGFQRFLPGPGLGGHCIPIDPFYLSWKARQLGRTTWFIELAGEVNAQMPGFVVGRLIQALNEHRKALNGARILISGVAYKPNVNDVRESPAAAIIERLQRLGAQVAYHDPHVQDFPSMRNYAITLSSISLTEESVADYDAVVIVTDHDKIDYELLGRSAQLIIDTRNAMAQVNNVRAPVVKA
jgi:UDP-N-acetyl-D-glucosamine dehydrogenase